MPDEIKINHYSSRNGILSKNQKLGQYRKQKNFTQVYMKWVKKTFFEHYVQSIRM